MARPLDDFPSRLEDQVIFRRENDVYTEDDLRVLADAGEEWAAEALDRMP